MVKVYFPFADTLLYKMEVLNAWYDIVSNFGGILGLCLGFSIISMMEVVYFFSLKLYQNLFANRKNLMNIFGQTKTNMFQEIVQRPRAKFEYLKWILEKIWIARFVKE